MAEGKSERRTLSRRSLLAGMGILASPLILALDPLVRPEGAPSQPPPTPSSTPDIPNNASLLLATATSLRNNGEQSSFREEGLFTREFFERVRRSTFTYELTGNKKTVLGTAWTARRDGDVYYVVTNHHAMQESGNKRNINLWRPGIDGGKLSHKILEIAMATQGPDLAVIKLQGKFVNSAPPEPIQWRDGHVFTKNEKVLITGFPTDFKKRDTPNDYFAMGSVVSVEDFDPNSKVWGAFGLANNGSSGSPAVINHNGEPLAVGTVFAKREISADRPPEVFGTNLVLGQLMGMLSKL